MRMPGEAESTADQKQTTAADASFIREPNEDNIAPGPAEEDLIKDTDKGKCFFYAGSFFCIDKEENEDNNKFDI